MEGSTNAYIANSTHVSLVTEESFDSSIKFVIEGILLLTVGIIGLFGNTMCIVMFAKLRDQMKFHRLMILLFVYDNAYILFSILVFALPQLSDTYKARCLKYLVPTVLPLVQIALTGSVYSTLAISLERYLVVCRPFYIISHKSLSTKMYIISIVTFSIIFNIPKFLELQTCDDPEESHVYVSSTNDPFERTSKLHLLDQANSEAQTNCTKEGYKATDLRLNSIYYSVYLFWMNLVFMGVIPYLTLVILNSVILNDLRLQLKHRRAGSVLGRNPNMENITNEGCIPLRAVPITKKNQILLAKKR